MGKEQDAGGGNNIDAIRQLLQKLEDAARRDVEQRQAPAPAVTPVTMPETSLLRAVDAPSGSRQLASLQRSVPALEIVPPEPPAAPIVRRAEAELPSSEQNLRSRPPVLMPAIAFLLGVAAAIAAVMSFEDLRRIVTQSTGGLSGMTSSADPVSVPVPVKAQVEVATAPEVTRSVEPVRATVPVPVEVPAVPELAPRDTAEPIGVPARIDGASSPVPADPVAGEPKVESARPKEAIPVQTAAPKPPAIKINLPERIVVTSGERAAFPVRLEPMVQDTDGLLIVLRGVPERMSLSKGSGIGSEIWMLPAHAAGDLEISVAEASMKAIRIDAELVALDGRVVSRATTSVDVSASVGDDAKREADALKLDERAMIRLGELLLDTGDLAGARSVLERAAGNGSAQAALRLGETYDPVWLPGSGLQPAAGDPASARRWYEKAKELGNAQASERLEGLAR